ncbi:MAG: hypothetical protein AUF79_07145 [Crenarchaeota archaeon 13_1_20CM_2_51_8]|nr:MAG: hypothetical protein AUF79_07145 [Crenarchaeota archaeon 13_1_20CM_2_51_8]
MKLRQVILLVLETRRAFRLINVKNSANPISQISHLIIRTFSLLPKSQWLELRPILKASSVLGLVTGGVGSWKTISLMGLLLPAAFFSPISWPVGR